MIDTVFRWTSFALLFILGATVVKIILGPRGADRLTALSVCSSTVLAMLVLYGSREGRVMYLDVALVYAIFGFFGLLAIGRFFRGGEGRR